MFVLGLRVACLAILLYTTITITWQGALAIMALGVAMLLPTGNAENGGNPHDRLDKNPLKGKPKAEMGDLPSELIQGIEHQICQFVTYDAENTDSLRNFEQIKQNTHCLFAKRAKLWGSPDWKPELNIEENVLRCIPTFYKFACLCKPLGLDGFLYELPEERHGETPVVLGESVRRVLTVLSDNDPSGSHCMDKSYVGGRGWVFEFDRVTMFITSFGPCYHDNHARYGYESTSSYILFQPEISFAQHDLPADTPDTNWDNPRTVRDRIRKAFRDNGQPYKIPDSIHHPMAWEVVKPFDEFEDPVIIEWWIPPRRCPSQNVTRQNSLVKSEGYISHNSVDYSCHLNDIITNNDVNNIGSAVAQILEQSVQKLHQSAERVLQHRSFADDQRTSQPIDIPDKHQSNSWNMHMSLPNDLTHRESSIESAKSEDIAHFGTPCTTCQGDRNDNDTQSRRRYLQFLKSESLDSMYDNDVSELLNDSHSPGINGEIDFFQENDVFQDVDTFLRQTSREEQR